jgi:hypothetical protein
MGISGMSRFVKITPTASPTQPEFDISSHVAEMHSRLGLSDADILSKQPHPKADEKLMQHVRQTLVRRWVTLATGAVGRGVKERERGALTARTRFHLSFAPHTHAGRDR